MPKVEITIRDDGSVRPDFIGFEGEACMVADQVLHARLAQFGLTLEHIQITTKPERFTERSEKQGLLQEPLQQAQHGEH